MVYSEGGSFLEACSFEARYGVGKPKGTHLFCGSTYSRSQTHVELFVGRLLLSVVMVQESLSQIWAPPDGWFRFAVCSHPKKEDPKFGQIVVSSQGKTKLIHRYSRFVNSLSMCHQSRTAAGKETVATKSAAAMLNGIFGPRQCQAP